MAVKPRRTHDVRGMGRVYDWRGTGLLRPNGGTIPCRALVHHIPVIRNMPGADDFIVLADILKAQGLSLQFATDRDGNVALYNPANVLCFQARGLNGQSCGVEHMHLTITEPWTELQHRAAGWLAWWLHKNHGLPLRNAEVVPAGTGLAFARRTGHTTHRRVSEAARFFDRSDPGPGLRRPHVYRLARWYEQHRHFRGAPTLD